MISALQAATTTEDQEVAPMGADVKYAISPHGLHIAAATMKGSRKIILMDGVAGPVLDELVWIKGQKFEYFNQLVQHRGSDGDMDPSNAPVVFSEDGNRFAYVGRQGDEFVVMLDGKEFARGPFTAGAIQSLGFMPSGKRLCYILTTRPSKDANQVTRLVVEGSNDNPPVPNMRAENVSFSPNGEHYAFLAPAERATHLVVDGKLDPPEYNTSGLVLSRTNWYPIFTGDSQHPITIRVPPNENSALEYANPTIFLDGKPVLKTPASEEPEGPNGKMRTFHASLLEISVAPKGDGFTAIFKMHNGPQRLFFNNQPVADAFKIEPVVWSSSGKRYLAKCQTDHQSQFMVIDGKKKPDYRSVSLQSNRQSGGNSPTQGFTSDSSKSVYVAHTDKAFLVVEDEESDGYKELNDLTFTATGAHIGFVATDDSGKKIVVIDGKPSEPRTDARDLMLTSDAAHHGFVSGNREFPTLVIDGVDQPFILGDDLIHFTTSSGESDKHFLFNADGRHFVYCGVPPPAPTSSSDEALKHRRGFCLDGKLLRCENCGLGTYGRCEMRPFFTSDNKHGVLLAWDANSSGIAGCFVYVDGKQVAHFDSPPISYRVGGMDKNVGYFFAHCKDASEMGMDGVLTFLAPTGNVIKKIRVIPSDETTLATFAAAIEEQNKPAEEKAKEPTTPN